MEIIAKNKKAFFDYEIIETFEAGIVLLGAEVKGIKSGKISIKEGFVSIDENRVILKQSNISIPEYANQEKINPTRERVLLLNKKEIRKIKKMISQNGYTAIPLSIIKNNKGLIKVNIGLGKGLKNYDKREKLKEKDLKRKAGNFE